MKLRLPTKKGAQDPANATCGMAVNPLRQMAVKGDMLRRAGGGREGVPEVERKG